MKNNLKEINNIIITSFMGMGNTINLLPLAEYFKRQNKKVMFLIWNHVAAEIIKNNKFINKVILIPKGKSLIRNLLFALKLRKEINPHETLFVVSYPHGPRREKFISKFYGAKKIIFINKGVQTHDVITNIYPFNKNIIYVRPKIFFSKEEEKFKKDFLKQNKIYKKDFIIGIHPGCDKSNIKKRLPQEDYIKIIKKIILKNKKIFIFLGPAEIEMRPFFKKNLKKQIGKSVFFITEKNIRNSAVLMNRCNEYLGNDSGLMHIAEATGVKKIKAFIMINYLGNVPLGKKENAIFNKEKFLNKI